MRPARQRAELFVTNLTPKVSTNLLPITTKSPGRTPPDRQSLVLLVEVGGKRYILGRPGLGPAAPPEELISSQNHRKSYRALSAPHTPELGSPGSHRGLSATVVHAHNFLPILAGTKQTHLPGDATKANSKVKDSLDLHPTLPKLGCVSTGFQHCSSLSWSQHISPE